MADVVNLNRFRKAKARADDKRQAAANRVAFGRSKTEKAAAKAEQGRQEAVVEGAKIE